MSILWKYIDKKTIWAKFQKHIHCNVMYNYDKMEIAWIVKLTESAK